jgi:Ca-activated chloride channel family protein
MSAAGRVLALVFLAVCSLGWLDPSATPRAAARLYAEGKFDDAAARYNQALTDEPDSALLHFNLGDAEYRRQQYEAAARAFEQVPQDAAAEYNRGNALYQLGLAAEQAKPQDALAKWAEALVAYRRAIATDPADEDAKFNYEWVSRKIAELQKKLEEQKQDQDQQNQDQEQGQQPQDQQKEQEQKPEDPSQQGEQQPPDGPQPEEREVPGGQGQPSEGELSREEATALLDGERNEELRPDEVIRRQLGTGEAPVQDW